MSEETSVTVSASEVEVGSTILVDYFADTTQPGRWVRVTGTGPNPDVAADGVGPPLRIDWEADGEAGYSNVPEHLDVRVLAGGQ